MEDDYIQLSKRVMKNYSSSEDWTGGVDENLIKDAESKISTCFSQSYKCFLRDFGSGCFEDEHFEGLRSGDYDHKGPPNVVWLTLQEIKDGGIIPGIISVNFDGMGGYYSIDTTRVNEEGENPIILWIPGCSKNPLECEKVADSFGEFFYNTIKEAVERIEMEKAEENSSSESF